jgi:hypothetical protein
MLKKLFLSTVLTSQVAGYGIAQTPPPIIPASNPHKAYDKKFRACKKLALEQNLTGESLRTFVAQCVRQ